MVLQVDTQTVSANRSQQRPAQQQAAVPGSVVRQSPQAEPEGKVLPVSEPVPATQSRPKVEAQDLEKLVEALNKFMKSTQRSLQFTLDNDTGRTVIKVLNKETNEIVRQFPPEEILSIAKMITESLDEAVDANTGILLEEQS